MPQQRQQPGYDMLADILDRMPERVVRFTLPDHTIVYCNPSWAHGHESTPDELIGRRLDDLLAEGELAGVSHQLRRLSPDTPVLADEQPRPAPEAPGRWIAWMDQLLENGTEVLAVGRDVTDLHRVATDLAASEQRFRALADHSPDVVFHLATTPTPRMIYVSPSVEHLLGYTPQQLLDDFGAIVDIIDEEHRGVLESAISGGTIVPRFDFTFRRPDGTEVVGELNVTKLPDGGIQGVGRDVTEIRALQRQLAELALRDPLTGLANRRLLDEFLAEAVPRAQREGTELSVAVIDLDDFKLLNDTYGHESGDAVLREFATRMAATTRGSDVVARVGGDEFVVVYTTRDITRDSLLDRLVAALEPPIRIRDVEVVCGVSVGRASTDTVGWDVAALLAAADAAMYENKRRHHAVRGSGRR